MDHITYVGFDVHKGSIVVAVRRMGLRGEVREYARTSNRATVLDRLLRKLGGAGMTLRFRSKRNRAVWPSTSIVGPGTGMRRGRPLG